MLLLLIPDRDHDSIGMTRFQQRQSGLGEQSFVEHMLDALRVAKSRRERVGLVHAVTVGFVTRSSFPSYHPRAPEGNHGRQGLNERAYHLPEPRPHHLKHIHVPFEMDSEFVCQARVREIGGSGDVVLCKKEREGLRRRNHKREV